MKRTDHVHRAIFERLESDSISPLFRQLYDRLRQAILGGGLGPGAELPSTRSLAKTLGVARNTVSAAYEQLLAEGYLTTRSGARTVVRRDLPEELLHADGPTGGEKRPRCAPLIARRAASLADSPPTLTGESETARAFRHGLPAVAEFPFEVWSRLTARLWRCGPSRLLGYGDPRGYRPLREAIAAYLGTSRGVRCDADRVIVVSGSQQALDLTARVLLDPGDRVWIEDPGYLGARGAFLAGGASLVPAPVDAEGVAVPSDDSSVGLAYVTPARHYPLGTTMSVPRRLAMLDWAARANAWVVEDDYDSEFRYAGRPLAALQGIDECGRVVYVGTFSKVLFPAIRVGYLVVPEATVDAFVRAKMFADGHAPTLTQAVLAEFLTGGQFERHIRRMRCLYAERQVALVRAARRALSGSLEVEPSDAGMHLVGRLEVGIDDRAVAQAAAARGIVVTPLSELSLVPPKRGGLLMGYTALEPSQIRDGVRALAAALTKTG